MKRATGVFVDSLKRGKSKTQRRRWTGPKGQIFEEDTQHGELEKYNKRGRHEGSVDPEHRRDHQGARTRPLRGDLT
jgi:hypothetical protein